MALRKSQVWLDNTSGTLTEYTSEVNAVSAELGRDILDDTTLNEDWESIVAGIRRGQFPINGFVTQLNTGVMKALLAAQATSVSKTFQMKVGSRYVNCETLIGDVKWDADGKKLIPFSAMARVDGAVNETSVAL